ncbi:excalibur calcium-binding domain-containing protein [Nocardioides marmoriginsengisoli]|nr:excalibur calcium-binding domain-containing protein [Nocardioides marmoriginsengisoli]
MTTCKRAVASAFVAVLLAPAAVMATSAPASAAGKYYASCAKLTKDFPHGVAKSAAAAQRQVNQGYGRPAYGAKAKKVYAKNKGRLDRDKDGTACER